MSSTMRRGTVAKLSHHGRSHALERHRAGQVFQTTDGRLRAKIASAIGKSAHRHLEGGIAAQGVTVIGIRVVGGDQQGVEADHLRQRVLDALWSARVLDAARQTLTDAQTPISLGQQQGAGVGGETAAIKGGVSRLTGNR